MTDAAAHTLRQLLVECRREEIKNNLSELRSLGDSDPAFIKPYDNKAFLNLIDGVDRLVNGE